MKISNLPSTWKEAKLGDLAKYQNGKAFKSSEWEETGTPIIRIQNLTGTGQDFNYYNGKVNKRYHVKSGDLLISWSASLGVFKWPGPDAYLNQHIFKVDNLSNNINSNFFYFRLLKDIEKIKAKTRGSTMKHVTKGEFKKTPILMPPLQEQKKIAAVLNTVQKAIEKTEAVIKAAKELKKSLMEHLFTYGPIPINKANEVRLQETDFGNMPKSWKIIELGKFSTLQRGKDLPVKERKGSKYPVIGSNGITGRHVEYVDKGPGVLVGRSGSVGEVTWAPNEYWPLNTSLWVKDFHENHPKYIYYFLDFANLGKYAAGVSVPTLNRNLVHPLKLAVPETDLQRKIADILTQVDVKVEASKNKKFALEKLFNSLLDNLMTAKIRVNNIKL